MTDRMRSTLVQYAIWTATLAVIAWALYYTYQNYNAPKGEYQTAFMSSLAATLIGLVVGIPAALEINRRQAAAEDARNTQKHELEESERRDRILKLIESELAYNETLITDRTEENDGIKERILAMPLVKQDVWEAFSDGGELQCVKDPELLNKIAAAYYEIRGIAFLEERAFDAAHFSGMRSSNQAPVILRYLELRDEPAIGSIQRARVAIVQARHAVR